MSERPRAVQRIDNILTKCCQKSEIPILNREQQRLAANSFAKHIKNFVCVQNNQLFDESWRVEVQIDVSEGFPKYPTVYLTVQKGELKGQFGIGFPACTHRRPRTKNKKYSIWIIVDLFW